MHNNARKAQKAQRVERKGKSFIKRKCTPIEMKKNPTIADVYALLFEIREELRK